MAFRCTTSLQEEMQRLERLREEDPISAANLVGNGTLMVEFARDGNMRALQCAVEHIEQGDMLLFYTVRMFREACTARRLDVLRFMLFNGFDLQQNCMRNILHSIVEGVEGEQSAEEAQPLARFLIDAGVDVNWQRKGDLYTALHLACRSNLFGLAYLLVLYGADVNAIAADDTMPLMCAKQLALSRSISNADRVVNGKLVAFLVENRARATWRQQKPAHAAIVPAASELSERQNDGTERKGQILSFSSSFNLQCGGSGPANSEGQHSGLTFDTLDTPNQLCE